MTREGDLTADTSIARNGRDERSALRSRWDARNLLPPAAALVVSWLTFAIRSGTSVSDVFNTRLWSRWDSSWYVRIAQHGYDARWHCGGRSIPPGLPPGNYLCGTVAWFPGYPAVVRVVSTVSGLGLPVAAVLVSWSSWFVLLAVVWRLLADSVSTATRWACLMLCAFAPGAIYFAAVFPISMTIAAMALCLYFAFRSQSRWAPIYAFLAGLLAGSGYVSAVVLCPALLVGLVLAGRVNWRPIVAGSVGVACGFCGVLLAQQLSVGIWDGYFIAQSKYARGSHNPFHGLTVHLKPLWDTNIHPGRPLRAAAAQEPLLRAIAEQAAYTAALLALAIALAAIRLVRRADRTPNEAAISSVNLAGRALAAVRTRLSPLDAAALATAAGAWVIAYSAGDRVSSWRSESFVVFAVLLLRRVPAWLLVVPLGVGSYIAWKVAHFFFDGQLI